MTNLLKRKKKIAEDVVVNDVVTQPEQDSCSILSSLQNTEDEFKLLYHKMADAQNADGFATEVRGKLKSLKRTSNNLVKAYQKTVTLSDELSARTKDLSKKKRMKIIPRSPANSVIDLQEIRQDHFAKGMSVYKLLIICYIGSFFGVIIEMLWWYLKYGLIESRAGLIYGPFNLLYGCGAAMMTVALYRFRNKGRRLSFAGGFLIGGVLEYVCSWAQEMVFGSTSWDYSGKPFNINGRICLLYTIFWGVLGVLWVKTIYPWMAKLILKIPKRVGKIATWIIFAFFVFNSVVTVITVWRWSERIGGVQATNVFWQFIDVHFPNERMERVFANMKFG